MSVLNLLGAGDNLVSVPQLYGATYTYFKHVLPHLGSRFASPRRSRGIDRGTIDDRTKAVFCETVGNPAGNVIDLAAGRCCLTGLGVPVIADNTVPTPFLLKPIEHGADVVVHSVPSSSGVTAPRWAGSSSTAALPVGRPSGPLFPLVEPEPAFHGVRYATDFPDAAYITRCRTVGFATQAPRFRRSTRSCTFRASRRSPYGCPS